MVQFFSQILNGLVIGNIYALIAIGFSLIFGVANLINFAQGSLLMLGAFLGYTFVTVAGLSLPLAIAASIGITTLAGMVIERVALRPLENAPWIAPLLSTIAITMILDQGAELVWGPEIHRFPSPLSAYSWTVGVAFISGVDVAIFSLSITSVLLLWLFLGKTWAGRALRAMSQDIDAARQMGVNVDLLRQVAFGLGAALAALAGVMVAMYYQNVFPQMGIPFGMKGFVAALLGGLASIPGAIVGGLSLGVLEALAVGYVGEGYRDMVAFSVLLVVLLVRPQGLLGHRRLDALGGIAGASGIMPSTSVVMGQGGALPTRLVVLDLRLRWLLLIIMGLALLPVLGASNYVIQSALVAVVFAILAASLTVLSGSAGLLFIGFAGFFGIGGYITAFAAKMWGLPSEIAIPLSGLLTAVAAVVFGSVCLKLTGHVVALATLAIGMLIWLVMLTWISVTHGPMGIPGIPAPRLWLLGNLSLDSVVGKYWLALLMLAIVLVIANRLLTSPIGRVWRAIREDRPAAHAAGVPVARYLTIAFAVAGFGAGIAGSMYAYLHRFINPDSFRLDTSFLLIAAVVLGGLGNLTGAVFAGAVIALLPEFFREFADYRMVAIGFALLLCLRFRPHGIAGVR